jgi:hypothetical protein
MCYAVCISSCCRMLSVTNQMTDISSLYVMNITEKDVFILSASSAAGCLL